jgi:putative N6-adenine-specific DNA methylase
VGEWSSPAYALRPMDCLAVCAPGLEHLLAGDLHALGIRRARPIRGGITFTATSRQVYAANVWLRTASRVVVRVARFRASTFADLERHAREIDWSPWITTALRPELRVTSHGSRLYHTGAIAERVARAIAGGAAADASLPPQLVVVRVVKDMVSVSIDASGEHLHRRGWRLGAAKAPLRETLAAAMVLASGWDRSSPFVDPMCGSGTVAIEAALVATGRAPGAARTFAFERWPSFQPGTWASVRDEVRRAEQAATGVEPVTIVAADRDEGAVRVATENAARAGVGELVTVQRASLAQSLAALPDPPGWLVTNPPYGTRVGGPDLRDLYATLGRAAGWHAGILTADPVLARHARLALTESFRTTNGGIPVTFWTSAPPSLPPT